jgi:hypothetical protein
LRGIRILRQRSSCRKWSNIFREEPSYVLGIIRKRAWHESQDNNLDRQLINQLATEVKFPGFTYIIALEHNYRSLRKIFSDIRGAEIYRAVA